MYSELVYRICFRIPIVGIDSLLAAGLLGVLSSDAISPAAHLRICTINKSVQFCSYKAKGSQKNIYLGHISHCKPSTHLNTSVLNSSFQENPRAISFFHVNEPNSY